MSILKNTYPERHPSLNLWARTAASSQQVLSGGLWGMQSGERLSGNQCVWPLREQENLAKERACVALPPFTYQGRSPLPLLDSSVSITLEVRKRRGLGTLVPVIATLFESRSFMGVITLAILRGDHPRLRPNGSCPPKRKREGHLWHM